MTRRSSSRVGRCGLTVCAAALLVASVASAQQTDLGGTWWLELRGDEAGALVIGLGTPHLGQIEVADTVTGQASFGFSRGLGSPFVVASGQGIALDSKNNLVGTLALSDPVTGSTLGTLTLERGKVDKRFAHWKASGSITPTGGSPLATRLKGQRFPQTFPVLSGGNPRTRLSGPGVSSRGFDLHVTTDTVLGVPAYEFSGAGPAEIDRVEVPSTTLAGRFMLTPTRRLVGVLAASSDFGTGPVTGKLGLSGGTLVPQLRLDARGSRRLVATGKLTEAIDPVLAVTPTRIDFGDVHLGSTQDHVLAVHNAGAGVLSGQAQLLPGSSTAFSLVSGADYTALAPSDPPHDIVVRFAPTTAGAKAGQLLLDVGGGRVGAQIVSLVGGGGIAQLEVAPTKIDFSPLAVGDESFVGVTVTNAGDGVLTGTATIASSVDFALALSNPGNLVQRINYTIDPGEHEAFFVHFQPSHTGSQTATLMLTGGGGATVPLSGSTP